MAGTPKCQPKPNGPLPAPESYERPSSGPKPERPGLTAIGTVSEPVPVAGLTANFSPMPRMAPPALGRDREGRGPWAWGGSPAPAEPEGRAEGVGSTGGLPGRTPPPEADGRGRFRSPRSCPTMARQPASRSARREAGTHPLRRCLRRRAPPSEVLASPGRRQRTSMCADERPPNASHASVRVAVVDGPPRHHAPNHDARTLRYEPGKRLAREQIRGHSRKS